MVSFTYAAVCDNIQVENGMITYDIDTSPPYDVGTVAVYECKEGFKLVGERERTCVDAESGLGGIFNGAASDCKRMCTQAATYNIL